MKEKLYLGKTLEEVEVLAVSELGVAKDDMYFDVISDGSNGESEINVIVDDPEVANYNVRS